MYLRYFFTESASRKKQQPKSVINQLNGRQQCSLSFNCGSSLNSNCNFHGLPFNYTLWEILIKICLKFRIKIA